MQCGAERAHTSFYNYNNYDNDRLKLDATFSY